MRIILSPAKKMNVDTDLIECQDFPVFLDQTKENLGQYILNPLLYIEGTIARDVRGDKE